MQNNITLREYQKEAINVGYNYLTSNAKTPAVMVLPTGTGKSYIIAYIAKKIKDQILVIQPTVELLLQNYNKFEEIGGIASIYSSSVNKKEISNVIYSTIGSIYKNPELFKGIKYIIADECHLLSPSDIKKGDVRSKKSMFRQFMEGLNISKVLGLTATPFRLKSYTSLIGDSYSMLNILSRERPCFFKDIIHITQIEEIIKQNFWSKLKYEVHKYDRSSLILNSTGADYTEESIKATSAHIDLWPENKEFENIFKNKSIVGINNNIMLRMIKLIESGERKSIICFLDNLENVDKMTTFINKYFKRQISASISANTKKKDRKNIIDSFKKGDINILINFGTLATGFNSPQIDCVIMGRPTNSLSVYYQILGRGTRIHPEKEDCLIIDSCDNYSLFGRIEDLSIEFHSTYGWGVFSKNKLLTGVPLGKQEVYKNDIEGKKTIKVGLRDVTEYDNVIVTFGKHQGKKLKDIPFNWLKFCYENFEWNKIFDDRLFIKEYYLKIAPK